MPAILNSLRARHFTKVDPGTSPGYYWLHDLGKCYEIKLLCKSSVYSSYGPRHQYHVAKPANVEALDPMILGNNA
jgi:hypothetical protein